MHLVSDYPYADRFPVNRTLPEHGRPRAEVLAELAQVASEEDAAWETGKVSGTMYCGDHEHYAYLAEAFTRFAHVNALQRDLCPSATRFEGEIIAMTLDLMHGEAVTDTEPAGLVTTGGSGSILHAVLAYREQATAAGNARPNFVKPETAHPAFDKACHLLGVECRTVPVDPDTTLVTVDAMAAAIDEHTMAMVGSAGNYPYGTIDPIADLAALALERGIGLHVDGCLGGFILPFGEELGYDVPVFDFRLPGVTSISADTHKYGYAFKGSSVLLFRDKALRNGQYFHSVGWTGGKYMSPSIEGSRSVGLLAATWASMVHLGRAGYRGYAERDLCYRGGHAGRRPEAGGAADHGQPDVLLLLHLRRLRHLPRGRPHATPRLALQRPAVPRRHPHGRHPPADPARRGRGVRGRPGRGRRVRADRERGGPDRRERGAVRRPPEGAGGLTDEVSDFIVTFMDAMLDAQQGLPAR